MCRSDVDDPAKPLPHHVYERVFAQKKRASQHHTDEKIPLLFGKVLNRRHVLESGVVDQDIEPTEPGNRILDELLGVLTPRDVRSLEHGFSPDGLYRTNRSLPSRLVEISDDNLRARLGQSDRDGFADPAARARDDSYAAIQAHDRFTSYSAGRERSSLPPLPIFSAKIFERLNSAGSYAIQRR